MICKPYFLYARTPAHSYRHTRVEGGVRLLNVWRKYNRRFRISGIAAVVLALPLATGLLGPSAHGAEKNKPPEDETLAKRKRLYASVSRRTGLEWPYVAAIDQYERTISQAHPKTRPLREDAVTGVYVPASRWSGELNPAEDDTNPVSIRFFSRDRQGRLGGSRRGSRQGRGPSLFRGGAGDAVRQIGRRLQHRAVGILPQHPRRSARHAVREAVQKFRKAGPEWTCLPASSSQHLFLSQHMGEQQGLGGQTDSRGDRHFRRTRGSRQKAPATGSSKSKAGTPMEDGELGIRDLNNLYHITRICRASTRA